MDTAAPPKAGPSRAVRLARAVFVAGVVLLALAAGLAFLFGGFGMLLFVVFG